MPWLAAFLFALHPICAESVAWISEQKNTLSLLFYLLAALAYLKWRRKGDAGSDGWQGYALATGLFVLAMASKTVTATLPGALLLARWWRKGRLEWRRDVRPLAPWFAMGAAAGLFSGWVERTYIGARGADFDLGLAARLVLAGRTPWFYLGKLLWPRHLIFIYPRWEIRPGDLRQWLPLAGMAAAVAFLWAWACRGDPQARLRRPARAALAAALFFLGSLLPTSGLFNVYGFLFSYVADHWQYLPALGIIALAAGAIAGGLERLGGAARWAGAGALVAALGALTWRQAGLYRNVEAFYRQTLAENPSAWMADVNLGLIELGSGREAQAQAHFLAALRTRPASPDAHNDYGITLLDGGRIPEAIGEYQAALRLEPNYVEARNNLGLALAREGRLSEAREQFQAALRLDPYYAEAHNNLGLVLANNHRLPEAEAEFRAAIRADPAEFKAYNNLGSALAQQNRFGEAEAAIRRALRLQPGFPGAYLNLGSVLLAQGRPAEALDPLRKAIALNPGYAVAEMNLGYALQQLGRSQEAQAHFQAAARLRGGL